MLRSALNLRSNLQAFNELIYILLRHRILVYEMARREITDRYAGQLFGVFWTFVHPLMTILIYVFLFNFVYVSKTGGTLAMPKDITSYILAGIIPWLAFSDVMGKAASLILGNANLVKQVIFPIEVLPVKTVISSVFTQMIFLFFMAVYTLIKYQGLNATYLLLPMLLLVQSLGMIGVTYILSSVGAYLRDTKDFVQVFLTLGLWFVPILYLPEAIPNAIRPFLYANPFTYMIWVYQDVLYFGRFEHPIAWIIFPLLCLFAFLLGYRMFRKLKTMFGNVL